ncbi:restriction endonuclease [Pseudomonas sp. WS 5532]|uniref:Restriction endonuclease n=1 Tax=Pseudomonas fluorescens TaxID=294 RepID=A0A1T2YZG9_PSEFL|nr:MULTISPECIES: EcoRII N-terminal effector-binding domain-containing protein [Pseudomonas]MBJ2274925.1 restriction endonuclease [Pseudomonas haemolytica]NMX73630.1 restriction endonuclease [Pseudomonas sp. WS 5532]OPA97408.1 restriction endonuclease [Pseudomonas fluorescens]
MTHRTFSKTLSANDVGSTGGHQGGILIPKSEGELLTFLPPLDATVKNPDAWIDCEDEMGTLRKFRFVYYNNKLHDVGGTRNEYRITYMTKYFREIGAKEGEELEISKGVASSTYKIRVVRTNVPQQDEQEADVVRIKIKSGWRRVH